MTKRDPRVAFVMAAIAMITTAGCLVTYLLAEVIGWFIA